MTDEYVSDIRMPVNFTNIPADKQLNNSGDRLTVKLRANGGDLFSAKYISGGGKIHINLSQVDIKKSRYFDKYYLLTTRLLPQITERFDFDHDLISISPDTIFLELEDIISRKLPVVPQLDIKCKEQYMLYDSIIVSPAAIMVSGPASLIDTLEFIETQLKVLSDLDKTTEINIPLVPVIMSKDIRYSDTEVQLVIPIEQFTESSIDIPIQGSSTDSGISNIRTFPQTVQVVYQVALKDYELVKPEMFILSAVYDPEKDKEKTFLKIKTDKSPDFVRITRIQPDKVEYIIQQ
jgi:hypothetical protein